MSTLSGHSGGYKTPKIILGTMNYGHGVNEELAVKLTAHFISEGYTEIDTAYVYSGGESEEVLGRMVNNNLLATNKVLISTKVHPHNDEYTKLHPARYGLSPKGVMQQFIMSLKRLNVDSVDILYLHFPDPNNSLLATLKVINDLYEQGKIKRFGLSNFSSWQVAEIYYLCKQNGYILPSVYQGMYNAITRDVERDLLFCLKRFNISFYAFNILAAGLLTGKHIFNDSNVNNNSDKVGRFYGGTSRAQIYRSRYWQDSKFKAIKMLEDEIKIYNKKYNKNLNVLEASLRWIMHHSLLNENDGIILGASRYKHYLSNLKCLQSDEPLHASIVKAFDVAWYISQKDCVSYIGYHRGGRWNEMRCKL